MLSFILKFFFWAGGLFVLNVSTWGQTYLIIPFTTGLAHISAFLVKLWDDAVQSQGKVIWSTETGFGVSIEAACNGVEAMIILFAALMAFPATWKQRMVGLLIGTIAIQALNLVRIISLFYLGQWDKDWFEFFHLYLWQMLIILDALFVWLLWLRWIARSKLPGGTGGGIPPSGPLPATA